MRAQNLLEQEAGAAQKCAELIGPFFELRESMKNFAVVLDNVNCLSSQLAISTTFDQMRARATVEPRAFLSNLPN